MNVILQLGFNNSELGPRTRKATQVKGSDAALLQIYAFLQYQYNYCSAMYYL